VPARVRRLFQAMHSIKGGAGYLGRRNIEQLAHRLETILGRLQAGTLPVSAGLIDILLAGVDRIQALADDLDHSDQADLADLLDRLAPYLDDKSEIRNPKSETRSETSLMPVVAAPLVLTEDTRRLQPAGHRFVYAILIDLSRCHRERGLGPVEVIQRLQAVGALLDARLEVPDFDLETGLPLAGICYQALVSSADPPDVLQRSLDLPGIQVVLLEPADGGRRTEHPGEDRPRQAAGEHHPAPSGMIRLPVQLVDRLMTLAGELVLVRNQALRAMDATDPALGGLARRLDSVTGEIQDAVMRARMQPVGTLFGRFPRLVRDIGRQLGKQINLVIEGTEVELDKTILEALADPLTHLVRNSCDHGIERPEVRRAAGKPAEGTVRLTARPAGGQIVIEIRDDGKGIDPTAIRRKAAEKGLFSPAELSRMGETELFGLIVLPGFSTASQVTDLSGRGVGMDVVKNNLDRLGGTLEIQSQVGRGSVFSLQLPLTLAILPCLLVEGGGQRYAIPQKDVQELLCLQPGLSKARIEYAFDQEVVRLRDRLLPLVRFEEVARRPRPFTSATRAAILRERQKCDPAAISASIAVVKVGSQRYGLVVDRVLGSEEIVVKSLHGALAGVAIFAGATILGDGRIALILSPEGIARHAGVRYEVGAEAAADPAATQQRGIDTQMLLVFRHSSVEQFAVPLAMVQRVERITRGQIERVGAREFVTLDGTPTRVIRLESCLSVSRGEDRDEMFLLIPRNDAMPMGILLTEIVDTLGLDVELAREAFRAEGIVGSTVIRGKMTLLLDLYRLIDLIIRKEQETTQTAVVPARKARVLLVEDTAFFQQLVRGYLEAAGYAVVVAGNGQEGLACLRDEVGFDLIVSDIEMPIMDGWTFARSVRESPEHGHLPLVALTTLNSERDRARAQTVGFTAYEVKVDRERFLSTVENALRVARRGSQP
jgi:two-component system chemotaxis sensor kinase CheA